MFKNKLNNYFFYEVLKSYFLVLISFTLLIWVTQCARLLDLITEAGLNYETYIGYVIYLFPKIFSQLMPVCFLICLFLVLIKLQDNKELEIYWISGISKKKILNLILFISIIPTVLALLFYVYIAPMSNLKSRVVLASAEFSMVNSLVKKNNFNSPLKNLTIFVNKNDKKGNLEQVYIFENQKTIIAKKGRVLEVEGKNYLELSDGEIHEKKSVGIDIINFEKTLFDFTKYQNTIVKTPKFQERSLWWLINNYNSNANKKEKFESLYELNKRILTPLMIPLIAILSSFLLLSNTDKYNLNRLKLFIFSFTIILIIFFDVLINFTSKFDTFRYFLYLIPPSAYFVAYIALHVFLKNEPGVANQK
jgi:lipopolysaccharide export system permease protein